MDRIGKKIKMIRLTVFMGLIALGLTGCAVLGTSRGSFVKAHPEASDEIKDAIHSGELAMGMTKEMVMASLGKPSGTHAYQYKDKTVETWTYRRVFFKKDACVKFEDGQVTGWDIR